MQIYFERSGGFAGIRFQTSVNTEELPAQQADPLRDMVYRSSFFELPEQTLSAEQMSPDRFTYRLTVTDGDRTHTVEMNGAEIPEDLQPLLHELTAIARSRPTA
jgi:hypothetical protein